MCTLKKSKYGHMLYENEKYFLYHNISGAAAEINEKEKVDFLLNLSKINKEKFLLEESCFNKDEKEFLLKEKFLIEEEENEDELYRKRIEEFRNRKELDVIFTLTEDCNFRCVYCFEKHLKKRMDKKLINDILELVRERIKKENIKYVRFSFYGGEPLLEFENIKYCYETIEKNFNDINKDYLLITNGYLLNKEKVEYIKKLNNFEVQITLDGPEETHNRRRYLKNKGDTFDKIISNVKLCSDNNIKMILRVNIDKNIEKFLLKFLDDLEKYNLNKKNISIAPEYVTANTKENESYECNCMNFNYHSEKILNDFKKEFLSRGYKYGSINGDNIFGQLRFLFCPAYSGKHMVFVPDGNIYACMERISDPDEVIGNIYNKPIYNELFYKWIKFNPADYLKCRECKISSYCGGGCGSISLKNHGDLRPICVPKKNRYKEEQFIF